MICIRKANLADYPAVTDLIERTFRHMQKCEYLTLMEIHDSGYFSPDLSLVAEIDNHRIVGHICLIEIAIEFTFPTLGLIQIAVAPEFQRLGIGSMLVEFAHQQAKELGYGSVISLGSKNFLLKLGYQKLSNFGIHCPYGIVDEDCLVIELYYGALENTCGMVDSPLAYL